MACTQSVVDVFMTEEATELDQFKGYVYSVEIAYHPQSEQAAEHPKSPYVDETANSVFPTVGYHAAIVANWPTYWVMQTSKEPNVDLKVGDTVRCARTSGHSDHMVILDKVRVNSLRNGVYFEEGTPALNFSDLSVAGAVSHTTHSAGTMLKTLVPKKVNFELYAYKTNLLVDLTTSALSKEESQDWRFLGKSDTVPREVFAHRYGSDDTDRNHRGSARLYQVVTERRPLTMNFTTLQKGIQWIKLVGYSIFDKPQVGYDSGHQHRHEDYLTVRIKGIDGNVISNNKSVEGAFCVLHGGAHSDRLTGSTEFQHHDMQGIAQLGFSCPSQVRQLTFEILDQDAHPAKFGRIHLWLKACVLHG